MNFSTKKRIIAAGFLGVLAVGLVACNQERSSKASQESTAAKEVKTVEEHYTFKISDKITRTHVRFKNHFGIELAGDLYMPATVKLGEKFAAMAVAGPYGAVKEQTSGLHASQMAERGFVTLAFDPSFTGESGGEPRGMNAPNINTEDFQAAVDYLATRDFVDPEKIGIIGICGWGGYALDAAAIDTRIKATLVVTMYDMSRVFQNGYFDKDDNAASRDAFRKALSEQRTEDFKTGTYKNAGGWGSAPMPEDAPQYVKDYYAYYRTDRGYHERSLGSNDGFKMTTLTSLMNTKMLAFVNEIQTPVLLAHGEKAHSRYFGETAFEKMTGKAPEGKSAVVGNKEILIVKDAVHTDLYDNFDKIPFAKYEEFFTKNLNK